MILLIPTFISCTNIKDSSESTISISSNESEVNSIMSTLASDENLSAENGTPTSAQIAEEQEQYDKIINEIISSKKDIEKVRIDFSNPERTERHYSDSSDSDIINRWCALLEKAQIVAVPWDGISGRGYILSFYLKGEEIKIGGVVEQFIYIAGDNQMQIMLEIVNFNECKNEFEYLKNKMGFN